GPGVARSSITVEDADILQEVTGKRSSANIRANLPPEALPAFDEWDQKSDSEKDSYVQEANTTIIPNFVNHLEQEAFKDLDLMPLLAMVKKSGIYTDRADLDDSAANGWYAYENDGHYYVSIYWLWDAREGLTTILPNIAHEAGGHVDYEEKSFAATVYKRYITIPTALNSLTSE